MIQISKHFLSPSCVFTLQSRGWGTGMSWALKCLVHLLNPQCREDSKYLGRKELYVLKKTNTDAEDRIKSWKRGTELRLRSPEF